MGFGTAGTVAVGVASAIADPAEPTTECSTVIVVLRNVVLPAYDVLSGPEYATSP